MDVYLNGQFLPYEAAHIPVEDRGFQLGDGLYEVVKIYRGRPFQFAAHMQRLARSCREIQISTPAADIPAIAAELVVRNGLVDRDASVYMQVTRGVAPRTHAFPVSTTPTLLVICRPTAGVDPELRSDGAAVITVPDQRWGRCDIKTINLLPNVLAKQQAVETGAFEAILVRDGMAMEGSSSNLFAVVGAKLVTHPATEQILHGITRGAVLDLARQLAIPAAERPLPVTELLAADEVFITGTMTELVPVVRVDDRVIGTGRPGPVTRTLLDAFLARVGV